MNHSHDVLRAPGVRRGESPAFRRLLVPLDGSPEAEAALGAAAALARQSAGEIRLLHVIEAPFGTEYPDLVERARAAASSYLEGAASRPGLPGAATTAVCEGRTDEEIVREAVSWEADAVVVTSHGRGGLSRVWLGGVADRCLHRSPVPVVLIHPRADGTAALQEPMSRVLLPLDGSAAAEAALGPATSFARLFGVPLELLRVVLPADAWAFLPSDPEADPVMRFEEANGSARAYLAGHATTLWAEGIDVQVQVVIHPSPARVILDRSGFDPLVMTREGAGGRLDRILLGRVVDKVVRAAEGPVVMVQPAEA